VAVHPIDKLFDHLEWADARVLAALQERPGTDARALDLYAHVLGAEHVWLARLHGTPPSVAVWPSLTLEGSASLAAATHAGYRAVRATLTPEALAREVAYQNSAGQQFRSSVEDVLLHVALHGSYHRGQVALLMRGAGGEPAATDYIALARGAPAATRTGGGTPAQGAAAPPQRATRHADVG
jgi:uncharacterized damage-inducible protein DinB